MTQGKHEYFISWSGGLSHKVALLLKEIIETAIYTITGWISSEDIEKGSLWFNEIDDRLSRVDIGIIVITRENLEKPWLLFEAGALSRGRKVVPILVDLERANPPVTLSPPLSMFQVTTLKRDDLLKLLLELDSAVGTGRSPQKLEELFNRFYADWSSKLEKIIAEHRPLEERKSHSVADMEQTILKSIQDLQSHMILLNDRRNDSIINLLEGLLPSKSIEPASEGGSTPDERPRTSVEESALEVLRANRWKYGGGRR